MVVKVSEVRCLASAPSCSGRADRGSMRQIAEEESNACLGYQLTMVRAHGREEAS